MPFYNYGSDIIASALQSRLREDEIKRQEKQKEFGGNITNALLNAGVAFLASGGNPAMALQGGIKGLASREVDPAGLANVGLESYTGQQALNKDALQKQALSTLLSQKAGRVGPGITETLQQPMATTKYGVGSVALPQAKVPGALGQVSEGAITKEQMGNLTAQLSPDLQKDLVKRILEGNYPTPEELAKIKEMAAKTRYYETGKSTGVKGSGKNISLGNLSKAGANAFSLAQKSLDDGEDPSLVIEAINKATDVPSTEKPIIIKSLTRTKKREL